MKRHSGTRFSALMLAAGAMLPMALMIAPAPALAQFSDSFNFLKAVKDRDGDKATQLLQKPGSTIVNTRDGSTGQTALHIVVARRDLTWMGFLLAKGANPNLTDKDGNTPLMLATQLRFPDGARTLLAYGAQVDKANDNGETALIRAVQLRDVTMTRFLIAEGANPDKRDAIAGMSARDYAARERRTPGLVESLNTAKPKPDAAKVQGPSF
jgi:ankyrin repeat protein